MSNWNREIPMASTLECPDEGQLRLFLDGTPPDRDRPGLEEHLKTCAGCRERLARLREDAALVSAALAASAPAVVDTARAWERFRAQAPTANRWPTRRIWDMFSARYRRMRRPVLGLIGVAAVLAAVILVPPLHGCRAVPGHLRVAHRRGDLRPRPGRGPTSALCGSHG